MQRRIDEVLQEIGCATTRFDSAMGSLGRDRKRYLRMWAYYSNPMRQAGMVTDKCERPYRQAQEWGMPERITGYRPGEDPGSDGMISEVERKEVVVENDIAWRIDTMIDYLFGRPPVLRSTAADGRREQIQQLLGAIIQHNGGIAFLQQMALMGAVHGFVDIAVTLDVEALEIYI